MIKNRFSVIGLTSFIGLAISFLAGLSLLKCNKYVSKVEAIDITDYSACQTAYNSNSGSAMLTALRNITASGTSGSYSQLWTTYKNAFVKDNGKMFDYYSSYSNFTPGTDQAGSYSNEGDVYNREHSIPKSWWNQSGDPQTGTQGTDPFFVVPTDGYVNNKRSNYPMGMVASASYTSQNGFSKLGTAVSSWGYTSSVVFEPDDSVKGDFARMHFYVIAKYSSSYNWTNGYGGSTFSGSASKNYGLTDYAVKLFSYWSHLDPVSEWESSVNEKLANIQGNRNPFIDHPEYADTLWGSVSGYTPYVDGATLSINPSSGSITVGETIGLTANASGGSGNVTWSILSGSSYVSLNTSSGSSVTVTGNAVGTATIQASYSGETETSTITVTAASQKALSSISVSNPKTSFSVGDSFSFGGTVTANFNDSTSSDVTSSATFTGYDMTITGNQTVTVSYTYSGTTKTTTYQISVNSSGSGDSDTFDATFSYNDNPMNWSVSNTGSASGYILCPNDSSSYSVALFPGIFSNKTITSDVVITINSATYGSGTTPTSSTYSIYNSDGCSEQISATQSGTLPSSATYTNVIYTVSLSNASNFSDDLAIKITKPGRQIRLKSVKVEFSYETSGSSGEITSISATPKKTFYVGETITSSDITVKDNNNNVLSGFTFTSYQFTYEDASSGGSLSNKTFINAVSYESFTCDLTAQVQRKAYSAPSGTSSLEHTGAEFSSAGIGSSYTEGQTATVDGITFTVDGYIYSSKLSLSSSKTSAPGKVVNTTPYPSGITNVNVSGARPDIQLSTDGNSWVNLSAATTSTTNYYYLKLYYSNTSQSNYVNITSFTVTMKANETPDNVANYIMYEDTTNQCTTKFDVAKGYFEALTSDGRATFMTSDDYVISTARTRFNAWAKNLGKTINQSNGDYVISNAKIVSPLFGTLKNNKVLITIIASALGISSIGGYFFLRRKELKL